MMRLPLRQMPVTRIVVATAIAWFAIFRYGPRAQPQELPPELLNRRVPYFTF